MDPITLSFETVLKYLPPRAPDSHKWNCGHVVILAGDQAMPGAAILAAQGSARVGAGLVTLMTHPIHASYANLSQPELICHGISHPKQIKPILEKATTLILGPGLTDSEWSQVMLTAAFESQLPMIVDAGAFIFIQHKKLHRSNWILTPHPGEAARLLGRRPEEIQSNRSKAVQDLQTIYGGVALLKGHYSLIATQDQLYRCPYGNPGMASGGMGDLLSGVVGGLVAQGLPLQQAACLGVCLHAKAGDLAAEESGERGLLASDLLFHLRKLLNKNTERKKI
ncbi:MAG: carbohydrate kinase, YjeF related protein [Gammaproteobacteria bacterium]|jgi:NAD(P)H-hydrate epimerase|nr:carbohydrate kinase, YjeF related protein [Gammaproteobacteria bacterium]